MRVGDRVRCIESYPIGPAYGVVGQIYTVYAVNGTRTGIRIQDTGQRMCNPNRFAVVQDEAAVVEPQAEQSVVLYTVVYIESNGEVKSFGFDTEERAQSRKQYLEGLQVRILGMKKITLRGMGA